MTVFDLDAIALLSRIALLDRSILLCYYCTVIDNGNDNGNDNEVGTTSLLFLYQTHVAPVSLTILGNFTHSVECATARPRPKRGSTHPTRWEHYRF